MFTFRIFTNDQFQDDPAEYLGTSNELQLRYVTDEQNSGSWRAQFQIALTQGEKHYTYIFFLLTNAYIFVHIFRTLRDVAGGRTVTHRHLKKLPAPQSTYYFSSLNKRSHRNRGDGAKLGGSKYQNTFFR